METITKDGKEFLQETVTNDISKEELEMEESMLEQELVETNRLLVIVKDKLKLFK